MPTLVPFNSKPCKWLLRLPYKRAISIWAFRHQKRLEAGNGNKKRRKYLRRIFVRLTAMFRPWKRSSEKTEEGLGELTSMAPMTPAGKRAVGVEEACRSFENYLVEMVVEEGKVRDLMDVEELLYCWNSLRSPVFVELVCRFYREVCKDSFSEIQRDLADDDSV